MKSKTKGTLCLQLILLQIVPAQKKSVHATENAKNASKTTETKTKNPTVQDNKKISNLENQNNAHSSKVCDEWSCLKDCRTWNSYVRGSVC